MAVHPRGVEAPKLTVEWTSPIVNGPGERGCYRVSSENYHWFASVYVHRNSTTVLRKYRGCHDPSHISSEQIVNAVRAHMEQEQKHEQLPVCG